LSGRRKSEKRKKEKKRKVDIGYLVFFIKFFKEKKRFCDMGKKNVVFNLTHKEEKVVRKRM
jgi:hypothetical protein